MRRIPARFFFLFLLPLLVSIMQSTQVRAVELAPNLYKSTLDNGLTVLVKEAPDTNVATVQLWVRAGSIYEEPQEAGITHVIEHMIFKGTPSRGPGQLAGAIESAGGRVNAYTSYEYTVYHATLPAGEWAMALDVLTDAVLHSSFDPQELEREKKVVLEELGMRNDRPNVKLFEQLMARAYAQHPYRLPVIGRAETISAFSREDILSYMDKHYHPENFTVVVVGEVAAAEVVAEVDKAMGGLARSQHLRPELPREPTRQNPELFTVEGDIFQPHMMLALPISSFDNPDAPVLDIIAHILGQGESSRLYRSLRDRRGLVFNVHASAFTPQDPGLFEISAVLDAANMVPALEAALEEIFALKYHPVDEQELVRAKRNLESDFVFSLEQVEGMARVLGSFEFMTGDPREDDYLQKVQAVTMDDVMQVARRYFIGERLTAGFLLPRGVDGAPAAGDLAGILERAEQAAKESTPASLVADSYLSNLHRFVLPNGLVLLVREEPSVPTVGIRAVFPGGLRAESLETNGAFSFIAEMLGKGTEKLSARRFADRVADMAGTVAGFSGKNTFGVKADFLSRFTEEALELVAQTVISPAFLAEEVEKVRPELLAQLKQQEDSLTSLGFREFNRLLFDGHPYGLNTPGSVEAIGSLSAEDLKRIYHAQGRPDRMVLAVSGAVQAEEVQRWVEKYFGDWKAVAGKKAETQEEILAPEPPAAARQFSISREKEQVHIIIGFLSSTLRDPDRYPLEVLDTVLSGQSGRLFADLRDRQSLAYSLSSFSFFGLDTGSFGIYIGTSPDKQEQARAELWKQLHLVRNEPISAEELQRAQNILVGHYELGLQTRGNQALDLALNETYGLGHDFGNRYIERIRAVTVEEVQAVAQRYILPERYVLVTVGATGAGAPGRQEQKTP